MHMYTLSSRTTLGVVHLGCNNSEIPKLSDNVPK